MLVQANDGLLYINPVVNGDHAYLTFANGYPEVVVKSKSTKQFGKRYLRQFSSRAVEFLGPNRFLFPDGTFGDGVSYRVEIAEPIVCPDIHEGFVTSISTGEFLLWWYYWPRAIVLSLWEDKPNFRLLSFFFDRPEWECKGLLRRGQGLVRRQRGDVRKIVDTEIKLYTEKYWKYIRRKSD